MWILSEIKEYCQWKRLKKEFEKDIAGINQSYWMDNGNEIPHWINHMLSEVEPKFIWYFQHFMEKPKEDLAKRCAWNEIKREKEPNIDVLINFKKPVF